MGYSIEFSNRAAKDLLKLPSKIRVALGRSIEKLSVSQRPVGSQKLKGEDSLYRIRVGDYRIIYSVEDSKLVVLVVKIGHRREIYR